MLVLVLGVRCYPGVRLYHHQSSDHQSSVETEGAPPPFAQGLRYRLRSCQPGIPAQHEQLDVLQLCQRSRHWTLQPVGPKLQVTQLVALPDGGWYGPTKTVHVQKYRADVAQLP